ncbi:MAG: hypothetical protein CMM93_07560 [Rickettsiales bacterium]|nr:hypothetical protein [Rickettsiales bacterium]|tara:strand:+ start:737 stop:1051 length:315 start_codon:yes stop_codon:yes gene_type:complete
MKKRKAAYPEAQIVLGEEIRALRERQQVTIKELAKRVRVTEQQMVKYEAGAFVPIPMLEAISKTLDAEIQKKYIRQISAAREREKDGSEEQELLCALYREAFEE